MSALQYSGMLWMEILGVAVEMCPYLENFDVEMVLNSTEPNSFTSLIKGSM